MRRLRPIRPVEDSRRVIVRGFVRQRRLMPVGALRFMGRVLTVGGRFLTKAV